MLRITSIVIACLFFAFPAQARHRHVASPPCVETGSVMRPSCMGETNPFAGIRSIHVTMHRERPARAHKSVSQKDQSRPVFAAAEQRGTVVEHPTGCPSRAFCGCGAVERLREAWNVVVSHPRELWLAANWFKFPRATPAPGMVAVRTHHVMVLEADLGGGVWKVYDANSGRHLTRIHARSIAGYRVVNPRGTLHGGGFEMSGLREEIQVRRQSGLARLLPAV